MIHQDQKSLSEYNEFTQFALLWEIPKNLFRSHCIRNDGAANVHEQGVSLFSGLVLAWSSLPTFFLQIYSLIHDLTVKYGHCALTNSIELRLLNKFRFCVLKVPKGVIFDEYIKYLSEEKKLVSVPGSHKITRCCCSNFWLLLWLCLSSGSGGRCCKLSHQDLTQFWQRIKLLLELSLTLGALIFFAKVASLSADDFDTHGPPQSLYVLLYQCV